MELKYLQAFLSIWLSFNVLFTLAVNENENITDTKLNDERKGKVNGRIVKLYSGPRPEPFLCPGEGFQPDPHNCAVFYRCLRSSAGRFTVFKYQCSPGTVYDTEKETCNYPTNTRRLECGGVIPPPVLRTGTFNEDVHQDLQELPTPISTKIPDIYDIINTSKFSTLDPFVGLNRISSSTTYPWSSQINTNRKIETNQRLKKSDPCVTDGFVGDSEDCGKFYRCVANNKGGFIKYEFTCSGSTVWDDENQSCNHAWAVTKRSCGGGVDRNVAVPNAYATSTSKVQSSYGSKITKAPVTDQKYETTTQQLWENKQHDELQEEDQPLNGYGNRVTEPSVSSTTHSRRDDNNGSGNEDECTESGFMGDSKDCSKFYRCVDNGNGGYTKYTFSCGEGTVWDAQIEGCNHAWAVKDCGGKKPMDAENPSTQTSSSSSTTTTQQTSQGYYESTDPDEDQNAYAEPTTTTTTNSPTSVSTTTEPAETETSNDFQCKTSGFAPDPKDCKKFYRCVDNGNGSYTKYEYKCGEGTVWDSSIDSCNHAWAVKNCGQSSETGEPDSTSKPNSELTTVSLIQITTTASSENIDYDNGYGQQPSESSPATTTTTTTSTTTQKTTTTMETTESNNDNDCKESGFMGDSQNCKKFYRCVDDGKGGFIRYEFVCGDGTIWDPSIEGCNHQGSKQCDNENQAQNPDESATKQTTTLEYVTEDAPVDSGYGQPESEETPEKPDKEETNQVSTQTPNSDSNPDNVCKSEGFMADSSNCRKFYRCVPNQRSSYDKYEFNCGEGTVWDQSIQACNHPPPGKKCADTNNVSSEATSTAAATDKVENDEMVTETTTKSSSPSTFTTTESTTKEENSGKTSQKPPTNTDDVCKEEGFFPDSNNCKKFYRCVDDGKGGLTKFEFTCGDKTVWDQSIQGCNHETETTKCSSQQSHTENESQPVNENEPDNDNNATEANTSTSSESNTSSSSTSPSFQENSSDNCTSEGFFANSQDCRKFYRCVDDGKGGYNKYDFNCGEGTVWVQEIQGCDHDNDINSCKSQSQPSSESQSASSSTASSTSISSTSTTSTQSPDNVNDEMGSSSKPESTTGSSSTTKTTTTTSSSTQSTDQCENEGFYGNSNDCTKFYRCVSNEKGGYTKYDFSCGEGTIWDQDLTTCNHPQDVANPSCNGKQEGSSSSSSPSSSTESSQSSSSSSQGSTQSGSSTSSSTQSPSESSSSGSSSESTSQSTNVTCEKAGYYANPNDCKKFYRCVDWEGDGKKFSVYHFECGEGTIWDPALDTCNHEESVYPPRDCSGSENQGQNVTEETTTTESSTTTDSTTEGQSTTTTQSSTTAQSSTMEESTTQSSTTEQSTTQTSTTQKSTTQSSTTEQSTTESSTTEQSTTQSSTTTEQSTTQSTTTTEQSPTDSSTTEQSTTQSSTTEQSTTESSTTEQSTTQSSTTEQSTTESSTTEQSTTQSSTTTEQSTTESSTTEQSTTQSSTTEQSTTQSSTTEQSTTESSTTEQSTTQSSTTEQSTTESSTTEQSTTQSSTTEQSTTESSTTEQSTTQSSTTEQSTTESSTTEQSTTQSSTASTSSGSTDSTTEGTTEDNSSSTTESNSDNSTSSSECPEKDDDQYMFVCPTSFRRHPKYCNLFYQCDEDEETHDVQIATFKCPNNTIYDEKQTKCVEESKADKKCDGEMAQKRRLKRIIKNRREPIELHRDSFACPSTGSFELNKNQQCNPAFFKCTRAKSNKIRGLIYKCPQNYVYWAVSRRCERTTKIPECSGKRLLTSDVNWNERWEIPMEIKNIAP